MKKPRYMAPLTEYVLGACALRLERTGATALNGAVKPATGATPEREAATELTEPKGLVRGAATEPTEPKVLVRGDTGRGAAPRSGRPRSCGRAATPEKSDTHTAVACMVSSVSGQSSLLHWKDTSEQGLNKSHRTARKGLSKLLTEKYYSQRGSTSQINLFSYPAMRVSSPGKERHKILGKECQAPAAFGSNYSHLHSIPPRAHSSK